MKAVILAGGKGRRLEPYSTIVPKPLMPVGDVPIMEIIVRKLVKSGFEDIFVACGHLAELIKSYFNDGRKWGAKIEYSVEDKELGTVGPLKLLRDKLDESFLVINGDTLTDLDFSKIYRFHLVQGAPLTIGVVKRSIYVDFGVVDFEENRLKGYTEKPNIEYYVSMGVYVFNPYILRRLPENIKYDLPDLVRDLLKDNLDVAVYKHEGFWLDLGRKEDFEIACEEFEKRRKEILQE
ncbi:MAG: sugar phosphate nucleotidyltransferase [candidate division WOR-3 bacterium]